MATRDDTVKMIQTELAEKGYAPGPLDGIWGRMTAAAVRRFQRDNALPDNGVVDAKTAHALFGDAPAPQAAKRIKALPWLDEAWSCYGIREVAGKASNPEILDWADDLDVHYPGDDVPWCGLFVGHCIGSTLTHEPLPANVLGARQWLKFGVRLDGGPRLGAVLVFWRGSPGGWQGHVGFYVAEDDHAYHVLGGNQTDMVRVSRVAKDRLIDGGARWPASVPVSGGRVYTDAKGTGLSHNEA